MCCKAYVRNLIVITYRIGMTDHILCAIDLSDSSINALRWAYKLAKRSNAQLAVLYSYRLLQTGSLAEIVAFRKNQEDESRKRFEEIDKLVRLDDDVKSSFITEIGFYSDTIRNFLRKKPSTLVVLSETMAYSIYDHKGETLLHFLQSLHVPMLIVPDHEQKSSAYFEEELSRRNIAS